MTKTILAFLAMATLSACTTSNDESTRYSDCEDPTKPGYSKAKYMRQQLDEKCQHINEGDNR